MRKHFREEQLLYYSLWFVAAVEEPAIHSSPVSAAALTRRLCGTIRQLRNRCHYSCRESFNFGPAAGLLYLRETKIDCLHSISKPIRPRPAPHHELQIYIPAKNLQRKLVFDQCQWVDVTFTLASNEVCSLLSYCLDYICHFVVFLMTYRHFHPRPVMFMAHFMYLVYGLMVPDTLPKIKWVLDTRTGLLSRWS